MKPGNIFLVSIIIFTLIVSASCGGKRDAESPFRTPDNPPAQPEGDSGGGQTAATPGEMTVEITLPPGYEVHPVNFAVDGQFAYFTDPEYGLVLIDMVDTTKMNLVVWDRIADNPPTDLELKGGYAYVGIGDEGIAIIDVDPLAEASFVSFFHDGGSVGEFTIAGDYIYSADPDNGMKIIEISDPVVPTLINTVEGGFYGIDYADGYAYLASGPEGLTIVDVDPPEDAQVVTTVATVPDGSAVDVKVLGGYAYLATGNNGRGEIAEPSGFEVINVTPPEQAAVLNSIETNKNVASKILLYEGFAYAWSGEKTIDVIDISSPAEASVAQSWPGWSDGKMLTTSGPLMFVLQYTGGLKITALTNE